MRYEKEVENKFSHLVGLNEGNNSINQYDNSNDSDDIFEDIKVSKNITFSRSRTYYGDQIFLMTPVRSNLTSETKENKLNDLSPSINNLKKVSPSRKTDQNNALKVKTPKCVNEKNYLNARTPDNVNSKVNLTKNTVSVINALDNTDNGYFNVSNHIGATSTPSSSDNSLLQSSTPKAPKISSIKKYTLMKAALSAKKNFEEMIQKVNDCKNIEKCGENNLMKNANLIQTESLASPLIPCTSPITPKTPLNNELTSESVVNDNTPTSVRANDESDGLAEIKQLGGSTTIYKYISTHYQNKPHPYDRNLDEDDDLPPTQPITSILLRGVVAYVEVRTGGVYYSGGTKAELESMGAKVENNFTKKVTHCFFHNGRMSTYRKAIEWKVPLLSIYWIIACKEQLRIVPIEGYETDGLEKYKKDLVLHKLKPRIRRPMTDSKLLLKQRELNNRKDKANQAASSASLLNIEGNKIINALHSVAGDIKKASNQFEKILTSPELRKAINQRNCDKRQSQLRKAQKNVENCNKLNKKLVFGSSSKNEQKKNNRDCASTSGTSDDTIGLSNDIIRVSYDSDDLLDYAKKQAAQSRCSAPPRLLTSKKFKQLTSSCNSKPVKNKNDSSTSVENPKPNDNGQVSTQVTTKSHSKHPMSPCDKSVEFRKPLKDKNVEDRPKTRKRKLYLPSRTIETFHQSSSESPPDLCIELPYKLTPNKRQKKAPTESAKTKVARNLPPLISSDWESDDSISRSRKSSSALFVKKEKKVNPHRNIPTIVCTSLRPSDVGVVETIVNSLGKFVLERTVSERTTHVVTPSPRRTINLMKGIARGCWILNIKWIFESMESNKWLHEERFELLEFSPSVRLARVERQAFGPEFSLELFKDIGPFYVSGSSVPPKKDLTELLQLGGGVLVTSARVANIIIGSCVPYSPTGQYPQMIKEKWVLDCISQLQQLDVHDYISVVPNNNGKGS